jgi:site-specific DNA recombinase
MKQEQPMRAGIYYRVSTEEQVDGFSLDAQRRILADYCAARGWPLAGEYAEEGRSARTDRIERRPAFKRMLDDAVDGLIDVVVVHKIDRFARNIRVTFESLDLLARHNTSFVAVAQPDLDYTRPEGRMFMSMMAGLAQYYSDNLSQETKKGKAERKRQGFYNGHLPFGLMKGADGVPVPDPATIDGLRLAFDLAADGRTDREVAQLLNERGHRTTGARGRRNPFTKDTVCAMLQNRFYVGELPALENNEHVVARHMAVIERELFDLVQAQRERRATARGVSVPRGATVYSLSGLGLCAHCGGRMQIQRSQGKARLYCAKKRQGLPCVAKSGPLDAYERQLAAFLDTFVIPPDYRERLRAHVTAEQATPQHDIAAQRQRVVERLARLKELYGWGDLPRDEYLMQRGHLQLELATLDAQEHGQRARLDGLAELLASTARAWQRATAAQRQRLVRLLFSEVIIRDAVIETVRPHPELAGFFLLNQEGCAETADIKTGSGVNPDTGSCKGAEVTGNGCAR